ncbi:MAG: hypothetical protein NT154_18695 [Verrucomicrobia bacterium]|nr:hypothetical protein [Verrucomicrobiota bacterium]
MPDTDSSLYDLDFLLAEIAEDEKIDREAKRILSQEDIKRLVEESRRRREMEQKARPP